MTKADKYSILDLKKEFPTEDACLDFLFDSLHSRKCACGGTYSKLKNRKQFQCSQCRFQIAPMAGTIFEKSTTPLTLWFHALYVFSNAKSGISSNEMQRHLGTTYKTAWRILHLIRKSLKQDKTKLKGTVEYDETYLGGKSKSGRNNEKLSKTIRNKSAVLGAIERGGNVKAKVSKDIGAKSVYRFLRQNIKAGLDTDLYTDSAGRYNKIARGFERFAVNHSMGEYVRGNVHINHLEAFWAHVKRSIKGTYKVVSKKHLQAYLDAFVWHYNQRNGNRARFADLLARILLPDQAKREKLIF